MNRATWLNLAAVTSALALTAAVAWPRAHSGRGRTMMPVSRAGAAVEPVPLATGGFGVTDATGHVVPLQPYQRIVSTNLATDRLLLELCEPTRILAVSSTSAARQRDGYRYRGRPTANGFGPPEAIVALKPDLVLTNSFGRPGEAERLRNADIEVFELGELRGMSSFATVVSSLGLLLGVPERAERVWRGFSGRMQALAAAQRTPHALRALYLSTLGPDLQGGTVGTSYHDVMVTAGLVDVAAVRYRDWPAYSAEQVLALAPDLIVTRQGSAEGVCKYPGMDHVPACQGPGRIIELPAELLDEPGLGMLEAAEELARMVKQIEPAESSAR